MNITTIFPAARRAATVFCGFALLALGGFYLFGAAAQKIPHCCDIIYENPARQPVAPAPNTFSIGGAIRYNNRPVAGATVNLSGAASAAATTDAAGNFQFSGLAAGGPYTVAPAAPNFLFTPASRTYANLGANRPRISKCRAL